MGISEAQPTARPIRPSGVGSANSSCFLPSSIFWIMAREGRTIPGSRRVLSSLRGAPTLRYQAFYCEETVYHLAREPHLAGRPREVVFISNAAAQCAMWHQRACPKPGWPILWDYHVIL